MGTLCLAFAILGITAVPNSIIGVPVVILVGIAFTFYFVPQHVWLTLHSSAKRRGMIIGLGFLGSGVAMTSAPYIYGWLADKTGMLQTFRLIAAPVLVSFILFLLLVHWSKR